jgi:uncharacterized protein (TIGR02266 family)
MWSENEEHAVMRSTKSEWQWQDADDADADAERRLAERVLVDCEVDYGSDDTFLFAQATNISALGIFLQTREPEPEGTRLNLRFSLSPQEKALEVEGIVRWVNRYRPGDINNINPGMGIEFTSLSDVQRDQIMNLIQRIAFLA